jgi:hypothetical protein
MLSRSVKSDAICAASNSGSTQIPPYLSISLTASTVASRRSTPSMKRSVGYPSGL